MKPPFQKSPVWFTSLLIFAICFPVFAEDLRNDAEVARRGQQLEEETAAIASKAREKKSLTDLGKVSYSDVLASPDDLRMNVVYAQQQAAANNLLAAAAALERVLMIKPDEPQVRLFYAVVLFRLDNLIDAERELTTLEALSPPPAIKSEIDRYKKEIKRRKKLTRITLRQSNGFGYDHNRNASPSSKHRLFANTELNVGGAADRRSDTHLLNVSTVDVVRDLGLQGGHEVFGSFTYYRQEQTTVDSLDLGSLSYELGGTYKSRLVNFTPSFEASHVFLSAQTFLRSQAAKFELSRKFKKFEVSGGYKLERQDYSPIDENGTARERNGNQHQYSFGGSYQLIPTMRVFVNFAWIDKHAKNEYNAYIRYQMTVGHTWVLPRGFFMVNIVEPGWDFYREPDVAIAGRERRDKTFRYRLTIGAPLSAFGLKKILPAFLEDITASASYEYYRSLSTITNYTYHNNKFQALLTKTIEF